MKARKLAVEAIAKVAAEGVERAKHARKLSAAEVEEVGGGIIYGGPFFSSAVAGVTHPAGVSQMGSGS